MTWHNLGGWEARQVNQLIKDKHLPMIVISHDSWKQQFLQIINILKRFLIFLIPSLYLNL